MILLIVASGGLHHSVLKEITGLEIPRRHGGIVDPPAFRQNLSSAHTWRIYHEVSSASRPCRGHAHRRRRQDGRRNHHPDTAKEKPSEGEVISVGPGGRD